MSALCYLYHIDYTKWQLLSAILQHKARYILIKRHILQYYCILPIFILSVLRYTLF